MAVLRYKRWSENLDGDSQQTPVILIHGLFGSAENLGMVARGLAEKHTVIGVDLRNHGQSPHLSTMTIAEMADDLKQTLDELGFECVNLLGHSLGGKVAMQFAQENSNRVSRLIVADIAPIVYEERHREIIDAMLSLPLTAIQSRQQAAEYLSQTIADTRVVQFLLTNLSRDASGGYGWRLNLAAINENYAQVRAAPASQAVFSGETLFVRGALSDYVPDSAIPRIKELFPHSKLVTISAAGHWLHAEKPTEFNEVVSDFL